MIGLSELQRLNALLSREAKQYLYRRWCWNWNYPKSLWKTLKSKLKNGVQYQQSTQIGKTREVAFSITQTSVWKLLLKWKKKEMMRRAEIYVIPELLVFHVRWSSLIACGVCSRIVASWVCHSLFQNSWVQPDIHNTQEVGESDSTNKEHVSRLFLSASWRWQWGESL